MPNYANAMLTTDGINYAPKQKSERMGSSRKDWSTMSIKRMTTMLFPAAILILAGSLIPSADAQSGSGAAKNIIPGILHGQLTHAQQSQGPERPTLKKRKENEPSASTESFPENRTQASTAGSHQRTGSEGDKWWAAQRNIESAIAQLEAYLQSSPRGEHAQLARQQLLVLKNLSVTPGKPHWVALLGGIVWRIASVEAQPNRTRVLIEVKNTDEMSEDAFVSFNTAPLVMIDNNGEYYPMISSSPPPVGVKVVDRWRLHFVSRGALFWVLQGNRVITVPVEFAPLSGSAASVKILYRDGNRAEPAGFSLMKGISQINVLSER
jgi:hypothetical protein